MNLIIPALEDVFLSRYVAREYEAFDRVQLSLRSLVAAFTICVYDWALLCIDEYELVGRSRFSLGKVLYYFVSRLFVPLRLALKLQQSRVTTPLGLAMALYRGSSLKPALL
jgi:Family of unknown function (DUF6533)